MICFWILFEKELSASTPPFEKATFWKEYEIFCFNEQSIVIFHHYKVDQNLPLLVQRLLEVVNNLNDDENKVLKHFFNSILNED